MTTHVFIVDDNTFKYHLEYMFVGTGAKDYVIKFNNREGNKKNSDSERNLVAMLADGCRIRKGDKIIFYLRQTKDHEGLFFGIFEAAEDSCFLDNNDDNQFLKKELKKSLTFRTKIKPYKVYPNGVTEWQALDEIKNRKYSHQMLWSLIYRKLKGERGNTMITTYESEDLENLISLNSNDEFIIGNHFTYNEETKCIITENKNYLYDNTRIEKINIFPRLKYKISNKLSGFEVHLQMYINQNVGLGINKTLDNALGITGKKLDWIGNEVSCGVGMQRIDIMLSQVIEDTKNLIMPIELKAVVTNEKFFKQIHRYIDWLVQYYIPNTRHDSIQPILICKKRLRESDSIKPSLIKFNENIKKIGEDYRIRIYPLKIIEYYLDNNDELIFNERNYTK